MGPFLYQKCQKNKQGFLRYEFSLMETDEDDGAGNRIQLEHDIVFNNVKVRKKSIYLVVGHEETTASGGSNKSLGGVSISGPAARIQVPVIYLQPDHAPHDANIFHVLCGISM